jgi:hypothetical protein
MSFIGGYDRGECLKTVEVYDALKNKWEKLKHMQVPRGRFDITVLDGNVYAVGGIYFQYNFQFDLILLNTLFSIC